MKAHHYLWTPAVCVCLLAGQTRAQQSPFDLWSAHNSGTTWHLLDVAYGHGTYVAVGGLPPFNPSDPIQASLLSSTDATNWTSLALPTNANFYGVSFVNDEFISVGDSGLIMTSPDGISWVVLNSAASNRTADIYPLGGVAFGNGRFVAMDRLLGNTCLVSTDATNWNSTPLVAGSGFVEMNRVYFINGMFIAGGLVNNGALLTSTNGVNWTVRFSPLPGSGINDLAYGAGRWVAVGDLGGAITSSNAFTWTKANVPAAVTQAHVNLHGVVYADGYFVVVGDAGTILTSPNGIDWTSRTSAGSAALNAVTFGNGSLVAVGLNGTIWQSGPLLHLEVAWQSNGAALTLSMPSGFQAQIQASSDLNHWTNLFSIPVSAAVQTLVDTNGLSGPQRFYQAIAN